MTTTLASTKENINSPGLVNPYDMNMIDKKIDAVYQSDLSQKDQIFKLQHAANFFLGQPYSWEPLGEGKDGKYYQEPLYRTDKFDCVTFTDTVLALAKSKNKAQFKQQILEIRYAQPNINYLHRTDWFTDLEWLPNAEKKGWLENKTTSVLDKNGKSIALTASTIIDKPNWYAVRPMNSLRLLKPLNHTEANQLLNELRSESKSFKAVNSTISYLPLNKLFDEAGNPVAYLFDQLPNACVVVIVRPNWQIRDHFEGYPQGYGSNLNVSHLGIALRSQEGLIFYHASSVDKKVVAVPLTEYLQHYLHSETIKGIHIEGIL